jgi:aspartate/glutamate racemase
MTGILKHFGFGNKTAEELKAQEQEKYAKALARVKKEIKELYKDDINEKTAEMVQLEKAVQEAERLAGQDNYKDARVKLDGTAGPMKVAKSKTKDQKKFREEMKALRAEVTRLGYVFRTGFDASLIKQMHEELDRAGELADDADYPEARVVMKKVKDATKNFNEAVPKTREEFIKELDRAKASLKQLELIGLKNDPDYQELQKKIQAAETRGKDLAAPGTKPTEKDWTNARDLLKGHADIMKKKSVADKRKETEANLAGGEFMEGASEDEWADAVIDLFNLSPRLEKGDMHDVDVQIGIKPKDYEKYKKLQAMIAAKGLEEYQRPTINLTVKGKNAPVSSFGIIGGTGPLSDAEMLEKTMKGLESQDGYDPSKVHIRLLSAPPPRDAEEGFILKKYRQYGLRTVKFCHEPHSKMALASNTAHMRIGKAQMARKVGRGGRKKEAGPGPSDAHQVQDLSAGVVARIKYDPALKGRPPRPLIMGTKAAYDHEDKGMYGEKFADAGVTATNVAPKDSIKLQAWIDEAKRGNTTPELTDALKQFIKEEIQRQPPGTTHIVLGCTEIPLALGGHDGIAEFEEELKDEGIDIQFFDTEAFFAEEYTKMTNENSGATPPRGHDAPSEPKEEAPEVAGEGGSSGGRSSQQSLNSVEREIQMELIREMLELGIKTEMSKMGKAKADENELNVDELSLEDDWNVDEEELARVAKAIRDAASDDTDLPSGLGTGLGLTDEVIDVVKEVAQAAFGGVT